jgi:transcriptional regulator with XRE-family HTH domain
VIHLAHRVVQDGTPTRFLDHVGRIMFDTLAEEVGAALRRARETRNLSLRDAVRVSSGVFKASTLASYERAERALPLERFFQLAFLYEISPVRLLADVLRRVEGRPSVRVDVRRVKSMGGAEAAILDGFIRNVFMLRDQDVADTISLREGDLEVLATATGRRVHQFRAAIGPALVAEQGPAHLA